MSILLFNFSPYSSFPTQKTGPDIFLSCHLTELAVLGTDNFSEQRIVCTYMSVTGCDLTRFNNGHILIVYFELARIVEDI